MELKFLKKECSEGRGGNIPHNIRSWRDVHCDCVGARMLWATHVRDVLRVEYVCVTRDALCVHVMRGACVWRALACGCARRPVRAWNAVRARHSMRAWNAVRVRHTVRAWNAVRVHDALYVRVHDPLCVREAPCVFTTPCVCVCDTLCVRVRHTLGACTTHCTCVKRSACATNWACVCDTVHAWKAVHNTLTVWWECDYSPHPGWGLILRLFTRRA